MSVSYRQVLAGSVLDVVLGDPRWMPHPVRAIGWVAARLEPVWRRAPLPERAAGVFFWVSVVGPAYLIGRQSRGWMNVYCIYSLLALRSLHSESALVVRELERGDTAAARARLAMIVGRDTANLDPEQILRAAIETVAENLSDAVIAPLFYLALAGVPGMIAYKAVNTLDSMVGYRNARYREFGWASARMDDAANYVPARISAALVWLSAMVLGLDYRRSVAVTMRDARLQPSPNSGYPEAAVAGALGIRLGGLNHYNGAPSRKALLGDPVRPIDVRAYDGARRLLYLSAGIMTAAVCCFLWRRRA